MKIPLSWLKEFLAIKDSPLQIGKLLTSAGIEVEGIKETQIGFEKVIVGRVLATERHPNADKLCVAQVTDGSSTFQVVCGAPNCRPGIKTAFAVLGAKLTDEKGEIFTVKKAKLRGVESFGMLCSGKELGIGQESDGIMEFADQIQEGQDLASIYSDTVFEIGLTPNLGHCSSVLGIARELATLTGISIKTSINPVKENGTADISKEVRVTVQNREGCPRYACRLIKNVTIGPSPEWLKIRLETCGLRSVNNVVDVTNYVLLELGHPLHAFDFERLAGSHIIVRSAKEGEVLTTLDGKERILTEQDLLICDEQRPIALAGVMGGQNTEVTGSTRHILLEAAYFDPRTIRKTSKRLMLFTDSSKRFERGTDPNCLLEVLNHAATLIQQVAGGEISPGVLDSKEKTFPQRQISCRLARINQLLGTKLSVSEVEEIFHRLNFGVSWDGKEAFVLSIPTYRSDVKEEIDLVEEVARIYGYDNIPKQPPHYSTSTIPNSPLYLFEKEVRTRLAAEGLQEMLTCDLIGPTSLNIVGSSTMPPEATIEVMNPTSIEQSILRTSLLPALLQVVKFNVDHKQDTLNGFEVGRIHFKKEDHFVEQSVFAIILSGKNAHHHFDSKDRNWDFYDLKGIVENILEELGIEGATFHSKPLSIFHPGQSASVFVGELEIGSLGQVHPAIVRRLDVPSSIFFAEFNLHDMIKVRKREQKMVDLPLYPGSERDWTATLDETMRMQTLIDFFKNQSSSYLQQVSLIDIYRNTEKLGTDKKNVTFRFLYRSPDRTLENEEVDKEHFGLIEAASHHFKFG